MSDFHYHYHGKGRISKRHLLENTTYLEEKVSTLERQMDALTELMGVGFNRDGYEAFFLKEKKDHKK